jgi:NTP pyrophosphatase (non-canonical NTP hydrolase)
VEVKKLQRKIEEFWDEVDRLKKKRQNPEMVFIHLVEEVGELAREFVNKKRGLKSIVKKNYSMQSLIF